MATLLECLTKQATDRPDHDAVVSSAATLSYRQLALAVQAQAEQLSAAGITTSSVVGIRCHQDLNHLLICLGLVRLGATSFTVAAHDSDSANDSVAQRCGATAIVDDALAVNPLHLNDTAAANPNESRKASANLLFSTSGTTGMPKVVVHNECGLVAQAHRHIESDDQRFACLASMDHNFVKRHRLYCVAAGATNVFLEPDQTLLVSQCEHLNVNVLHVSAFQSQELLALPGIGRLARLRLKLGGSHVSRDLRARLRSEITQNLQAGYGTTETGAVAFSDPHDSEADESVGLPLPGISVRVLAPDMTPLKAGERGVLAIRCAGMFTNYLEQPELTQSSLVDDWFYTGDTGFVDESGRIHLCGRADDMFVFDSMNIYPQDIESVICQHPGVMDAAVLPVSSAVHGSIPLALVVLKEDNQPDLSEIKSFVRQRAGLRSPRKFTQVASIPRNAAGKIVRATATGLLAHGDNLRRDILRTLNASNGQQLDPDLQAAFINGDRDIALNVLALDSLARLELLVMLEVEYGAVAVPAEFARFKTLGEICGWAQAVPATVNGLPPRAISRFEHTGVDRGPTRDKSYIIRFFQRVLHHCPTVAQLHKALTTLEHRLTPLDVATLERAYHAGQLLPATAATKFHTALLLWFQILLKQLRDSGKEVPEPYTAHRVAPTLMHFAGCGTAASKTLVVCFPGKGGRTLLMPNAVLMQHTDATRYDFLIVAEPLQQGYGRGVPSLGKDLPAAIETIGQLDLVRDYRSIRTFGCSAGGYAAIVAGYQLGAEMAVSVGGRFHSQRYPERIFERIRTTWRAARTGQCSEILLSYANDKTRDRNFARIMRWLTGGRLVPVEFDDGAVGHLVLRHLVERGELAAFLESTVFAAAANNLISKRLSGVQN